MARKNRILILAMLIICATANVNAAPLEICAKTEGPPKHYVDASGKPRGYAIEIAAEAARRAGYQPQTSNFPW